MQPVVTLELGYGPQMGRLQGSSKEEADDLCLADMRNNVQTTRREQFLA